MPKGGEVAKENGQTYIVGDCAGGIKFISPADLEANWQLNDSENARLQPLGKSDPNLRVVALVVYKSDADVAEALSAGAKGESDLRDAKQWLDGYLDTVRESWGEDTTVDGKQLSSLSFPVAECDRIGKPSCPVPTTVTAATNENPTLSGDEETKAVDQPIETTKADDEPIETTKESSQPIKVTQAGDQAVTNKTVVSTSPTFALVVISYLLF